jgi:hypothetical protein|tara:strand:- start:884 stop:2026 length:1143 start_codon:yes stop_codon:yes gene_type:complete
MENDNVTVENTNVESTGEIQFVDSVEELQQSMQGDTPAQPQEPVQEEVQQVAQEQPIQEEEERVTSISDNTEYQEQEVAQQDSGVEPQLNYSDDQIEGAVLEYLSERLGVDVDSFDQLGNQSSYEDERLESIARFVEDTGRSPEDWFKFQSLNPSEMDDTTAIRIQMANKYPNLSFDEINTFVNNTYKLDTSKYTDEEINMSRLQMKVDASQAKQEIEDIRNEYAAPIVEEGDNDSGYESFIDEEWAVDMANEVEALEGLEFDLGNGKSFTYGLTNKDRSSLMQKNAQIESFFEDYVDSDGSWDFDKLNSHMTVLGNIDNIVATAYKHGFGEGQKGIVQKAANVSMNTPQTGASMNESNPLTEQLKNIVGNGNKMTFGNF